jgi:peptidoglycan hydrolase-like protein with peptidoglycan-binding domain
MDHTLSVTSPLTTGPQVLAAQKVLNGGNVYGKDFLQGAVDGQFGEETGRACIRAKYWLGYGTTDLRATYGSALDEYLHALAQPDAAMQKRRELRLKQAAHPPMRAAALAESLKHIGTKERPPGSNIVRFSKWYGITGPWCAMFVTWCYAAANSKAFVKGKHYAYVPYIVADARAGRNGLSVTRDPQPGDVVCYDWDGGAADHTGLFEKWASGSHDAFTAIEGNTSVGNDSNGGEVMRRNRISRQVQAFVRVGR